MAASFKLPLLYLNANEQLAGREKRSKLLDSESELYKQLQRIRQALIARFGASSSSRMDLHTELTRSGCPVELVERAQRLHGSEVDLSDVEKWTTLGGAFVFNTPAVDGYGPTHITVQYWQDTSVRPPLSSLRGVVLETLGLKAPAVLPTLRLRPLEQGELEPAIASPWDDYGPYRQMARPPDMVVYVVEEQEKEAAAWNAVGVVSHHMVGYGPTFAAFNIGIGLVESARGRGVGSTAQRMFAEMLFRRTGVFRIEACTDVDNVAEQRALEKAGFVREGRLRGAQLRADAVFHDMFMYSITRKDVGIQFPDEIQENFHLSI